MISAAILGTGHAVPDHSMTSLEVERLVSERSQNFAMPAGLISALSGVKERRLAPAGIASSDLAAEAGLSALRAAGADPMSVDLLVFAAASHDVSEPATAAIVQDKTGCRNATFVDIKNACNSFLNGLDLAAAAIATGRATRVLVTSGEVLSSTIDWNVASTAELRIKFAALTLGDAGGAVLLEASDDPDRGLLPGRFISDGSKWRLSTVLHGGSLMPHDMSRPFFECDSKQLQQLALEHIPPLMEKTLGEIGWATDDITHIVPHQVSQTVINAICGALDLPLERVLVTLDRFGNNAAASIPLALSLADDEGRLKPFDKVLLVCGAAGFTAGVLPVVW